MRVVTNRPLAERNRRLAQYLFFGSLGLLGIGLFVSSRPLTSQDSAEVALSVIIPPVALVAGYVATFISIRMTNLWVRQPRPEVALREGLKGASSKSVLYNYFHFPARHVLVCPQGIFAIVTRFQDGVVQVDGDKWVTQRNMMSRIFSIFRFDSIGNPTHDALRACEHVKGLFRKIGSDVDVKPLVVFVSPRVSISVSNPVVPVCHANAKHDLSLKEFLWKLGKSQALPVSAQVLESFEVSTIGQDVVGLEEEAKRV
jgi:hypothetical protein